MSRYKLLYTDSNWIFNYISIEIDFQISCGVAQSRQILWNIIDIGIIVKIMPLDFTNGDSS